ncbi:polyprenyl synthetase family protein [Azospirillum picis]|uniref:Octaprenyl-diphosphate synthase n=1 Tax=Azospirillum picis TaxID=488438 RepID=A0ABU0MHF5_9PROT|nr:polyprenyl synthetase family protein [Azospirillum picis]MBP2298887.1 octaprenyl-diphosphate synthase [Azospirillum picis]MDQ0532871.1 octaprenyl-diphosphate synthase [Azospirillum picis]
MAVVTNFEPKRRKSNPLDDLTALVAEDLSAVNQIILDRMQSSVEMIPQLAGYLIAAGGKRLRPVLTLAAANMCGYKGEHHRLLAAVVEFIHSATLLHDDVVDESDLRRGMASANAVFGNKASVLVGDFLFSRAFEMMVEVQSLDVLRILSGASAIIAEGEVLQLRTTNDTETSEQAYLEVIKGKTAELFAAACRVGAVVAARPQAEEMALYDYGMNLGIAFQLVDDVLDYSALQAKLGKTVGDDFREGKITLPVVLAFRRGNDEERAFWRRVMEDLDQKDGDLERAQSLMARHNALKDTVERARHYGSIARDSLGLFNDGPIKQALLEVIDFVIDRDF